MCGYDPFYWYDWELDRECAERFGFDNLQDYYEWSFNNDRLKTDNGQRTGTDDIRSNQRND